MNSALPEPIYTQTPTIKLTKLPNENKGRSPFFYIGILVLVMSLLSLSYHAIEELIEIKKHQIEKSRFAELSDKLVKGENLSETEWEKLCDLLFKVKRIQINACDSCHDYLRALVGGRHETFLNNYQKCTDKELLKGVKSLDKQINLHLDKIANPKSYIPEWDEFELRKQDGTIKKWQKDIERQSQHRQILDCILKNRVNER